MDGMASQDEASSAGACVPGADEPLPSHRPLDVTAFRSNHELYFALRDLTGISPRPVAMTLPGYFVLAHLDGRHSARQIAGAFESEFGRGVAVEEILHVVRDLDQALLLQTGRYEGAYAARRDAYLSGDVRDSRSRAPEAGVLREEILRWVLNVAPCAGGAACRGIVAPHLDYARGGPCYADAYRELFAARAQRYVVLGTNHFGRGHDRVVATTRDFVTPLGRVATDREFLAGVERRMGCSIREHEFDHWAEHSIELQVQVLQVGLGGQPFAIVPILCPDPASGGGSAQVPLKRLAEALRAELESTDRRTVLIAGADLSHVGQKFGETESTDAAFLEGVERSDRGHLSRLIESGGEAFVSGVSATGNETRICSVGALYAIRAALEDRPCRLLRYHQAVDFANETHVTCAAAVLE